MNHSFHAISVGERVRHVVHTSWGPGSVIECLEDDQVRVFFAYEGEQIVEEALIVPDAVTLH